MALKRYDPDEAEFDARYRRWLAALESGDEAELLEATAAIPTLNSQVLDRFFAVQSDDLERPGQRAMEQRLIVLLSELRPHEAARLRELHKARQRRLDRTTRVSRTVELPTKCARCGSKLKDVKPTGRPRIYCSPACRKAAYENRRARRDGAAKVQVVERVVTDVRERRIEVPHPRIDCIKSVLADEDAMIRVIWTLAVLVQDRSRKEYDPGQPEFERLRQHARSLHEALEHRTVNDQS
ncbi:MAG: hypothetical protein QM597_02390 [Aeromicrobium sp.]|uniref:hypothetical protein n=1 Tax=Aeromicrobium sp. TaxID=1871063 RepID=UPI0039E53EFB